MSVDQMRRSVAWNHRSQWNGNNSPSRFVKNFARSLGMRQLTPLNRNLKMFSRFFNTHNSTVAQPTRDISVVAERTFVGQFIDVALTPRYEKCRFDRCTFLWSGYAW